MSKHRPIQAKTAESARDDHPVESGLTGSVRDALLEGDIELAAPCSLPRGSSSLPQEVVQLSQLSRLIEATAYVVAEKGYAAATVADIIAYAGVSRATFYELFRNKEDCFLFCYHRLSRSHLKAVADAFGDRAPSLPEQLLAGIRAYMERVAVDKWFARAFIVEAAAATPNIRQAFEQTKSKIDIAYRAWFKAVRRQYPEVPEVPEGVFDMLREGATGLIMVRVRGDAEYSLDDDITSIAYFCFSVLGLFQWASDVRRPEPRFGPPRT